MNTFDVKVTPSKSYSFLGPPIQILTHRQLSKLLFSKFTFVLSYNILKAPENSIKKSMSGALNT